jgi:2-oxoglutarate ferredoxin oxidoreductase subunit beta
MTTADQPMKLARKDFVSDQEVRWCPGCGDYSILAQTQKLMPELNIPRENIVFISGIGCNSRLPYYMNTYGFHSIHGRAPTLATGLKAARPDLSVWVITGDGDGLSIGGNHLLHIMRRNVDVVIVLFNNRIYGLTKGQYSPTSAFGKVTKTSPVGSIDYPINACSFALGAGATFVARSLDIDTHHLITTLERAAQHRGTSFVEVMQNCNVYNDGAYREFADKAVRPDRMIEVEHGQPLIFGKERNRGFRLNGTTAEILDFDNGASADDALVHDEALEDPTIASILARMDYPELPVAMGVLRAFERPTYDSMMEDQIQEVIRKEGAGDLEALLNEGDTWVVE